MNEEDVPPGEWLCPRCRALHDIRYMFDKRRKLPNNTVKQGLKASQIDSKNNLLTNISTLKYKSTPFETRENFHKVQTLSFLTTRKNPFAELVRISLLLNPKEYELPEEYAPDIQFPGTSKKPIITTSVSREARASSYSVKRAQELDNNQPPLILRTCYFCRKGCRKAPLIHCDYCPLVYHADCIDPPLTILPTTRWMCPNHVEPVAEEKLLSSSSFCERVKLWNHFAKPIDHESIKISFLDKVHGDKDSLDSEELVQIGCKVPRKIKREYDRFMIDDADFEEESSDDPDRDSVRVNTDDLDEKHIQTLNEFLSQMIESSKLLESAGDFHQTNGESKLDSDKVAQQNIMKI